MPAPLPTGWAREADGRLRAPRMFAGDGVDAEFWREGFVHLPMLDADALTGLAAAFAELRPSDGFDPATLDSPRGSYHCTFLDTDRVYRRAADELVRDVFAEPLRAALPDYRILSSNIYVKPPGTGRFEIHQNWPTIESLEVPTLTAWVPLQDTDFRNGTLRLARGTHRIFPDVAAATSPRFFDNFEDDLIESYLEPVPVAAGSALIFDDSLLHWSGANLDERPRATFQIELIPDDLPAVLWIRSPDDESTFDLWEVDKEFWIEYPFESVLGRPDGLPSLGTRPNPNRTLTLEEFAEAVDDREAIRAERYVLG